LGEVVGVAHGEAERLGLVAAGDTIIQPSLLESTTTGRPSKRTLSS